MVDERYYDERNEIVGEVPQGVEEVPIPEGDLHLRLVIPSGEEFALPAVGIREVIQQEVSKITPIPNASPLLLGTINLRGEIIWVADLGQFLGYSQMLNTDRGEIPVVAIEDQEITIGLAVEGLGGLAWIDPGQVFLSSNVPDHVMPFVTGQWQDENGKRILILDPAAMIHSARWAA